MGIVTRHITSAIAHSKPPQKIEQQPLIGERVYKVAIAQLKELVAVIVAAILYPLAIIRLKPSNAERGKPVLLLHGYLHNKTAWVYHKRKLEDAGYGPIYTPNLTQPFASIETDLTEQVLEQIGAIKRETDAKSIDVITHSMGGIVGLNVLRSADLAMNIGKMLMLVPPLLGSDVLRSINLGECRTEILPESELLRLIREEVLYQSSALNAEEGEQVPLPSSLTKIHSLASSVDALVSEQSASIDTDRTKVIDNAGHLGVLYSEEVAEYILDILKQSPGICEAV